MGITGRSATIGMVALACCGAAFAGSHTWDVNEIFSTADGSVWFIELREENGTTNEVGVGGHMVTSTANAFTICCNVASPTSNRHLLFANQAFANLPGAPTPDGIVNIDNFFDIGGDAISYTPWDTFTFGAGVLPTDGVNSLFQDMSTGVNSPTNYAGATGSVIAGGSPPPGVPNGTIGSPSTADRLDAAGTRLSISWDTATCSNATDFNILFGQGSQLPQAPGGNYALAGGVCNTGLLSPFVWDPAPAATDGTGLIWWLMVAHDGADLEGPWGKRDGVNERQGSGPNGSSQQCGVIDKDTSSTCGH